LLVCCVCVFAPYPLRFQHLYCLRTAGAGLPYASSLTCIHCRYRWFAPPPLPVAHLPGYARAAHGCPTARALLCRTRAPGCRRFAGITCCACRGPVTDYGRYYLRSFYVRCAGPQLLPWVCAFAFPDCHCLPCAPYPAVRRVCSPICLRITCRTTFRVDWIRFVLPLLQVGPRGCAATATTTRCVAAHLPAPRLITLPERTPLRHSAPATGLYPSTFRMPRLPLLPLRSAPGLRFPGDCFHCTRLVTCADCLPRCPLPVLRWITRSRSALRFRYRITHYS